MRRRNVAEAEERRTLPDRSLPSPQRVSVSPTRDKISEISEIETSQALQVWNEGTNKRCPSYCRNQHPPVSLSPSLWRWHLSITGEKKLICFSDDDDALDFPNLDMEPQFDFSDAGKEGLKDSSSQLCIPASSKRECENMTQHFSKLIKKNRNSVSKTQIEE